MLDGVLQRVGWAAVIEWVPSPAGSSWQTDKLEYVIDIHHQHLGNKHISMETDDSATGISRVLSG